LNLSAAPHLAERPESAHLSPYRWLRRRPANRTDDGLSPSAGDLGMMHADGYIELKVRSKDIIISGGGNISTIEVEHVLYRHPAVLEAAVVARPDPMWGETPCAFVTLKPEAEPRLKTSSPSAAPISPISRRREP
jgi:acyl-CoA synthetase (AMP-forming)/AMP-acid ligase II